MKRSTTHILTTHTGSLPRSRELQEVLRLREERRAFDPQAFDGSVRAAVADVVQQQVALGLDMINGALAGLPPERMRLHLCWGNYEGPHHHDVPLREKLPLVLKARLVDLSFEGANPCHAHEWKVWVDIRLPDDKVIIPGVLDSTTNFIEHPELIAERLVRYAEVVGRERVIAGTDCGFGTSAWGRKVDGKIAWAKFHSMVEGAHLASEALW